ncbi:endo alpha-1,4 polygalactosaminidase [Microbacterium lushaniae]|nr:endo alpha-1,4 polygalactosaminidase [Microbacterium lushaniae]KAA9159689.1 endo alpha-1,4 polygalactosaminidase [Microbacterium lushaniae]
MNATSWRAVLVPAVALLAAGCSAPDAPAPPPAGAPFDYQLGRAYPPPDGVEVVVRDRSASPLEDGYSICYVNAFQTQPGEDDAWPADALLRREGAPVADPMWPDEILLDVSTSERRAEIAAVVTPWIHECADAGFDAVEFDNLDTFARSGGAISVDDSIALAAELVDAAHRAGLAAAQKNAAEFAGLFAREAGFDFAIAEECAAFEECDAYEDVYGAHVLDIEYTDVLPRRFEEVCADAAVPESLVLRDRGLVGPSDPGYVFENC